MNANQPISPSILAEILANLQGITFDLWGTLFDDHYRPDNRPTFRELKVRFFQQKLREAGITIDEATAQQAYSHAREVFEGLWKNQEVLTAEIGIEAMLEFVGVKVSEPVKSELVRYFQEVVNTTTLRLYPGVTQTLAQLHRRFRLGLISDTGWTPGRVLREQLRRHGLLELFRVTIFSDEIGHTKPHPSLFQKALQELQLPARACLHVGDLPFTDIKGAKATGCYTAWIYKSEFAHTLQPDCQPDLVLDSVSDLTKLLISP